MTFDAGAAAKTLTHGHRQSPPVEMRIWLRLEAPVPLAAKVERPRCWIQNGLGLVAVAGLNQKHLDLRILGQSPGND